MIVVTNPTTAGTTDASERFLLEHLSLGAVSLLDALVLSPVPTSRLMVLRIIFVAGVIAQMIIVVITACALFPFLLPQPKQLS